MAYDDWRIDGGLLLLLSVAAGVQQLAENNETSDTR